MSDEGVIDCIFDHPVDPTELSEQLERIKAYQAEKERLRKKAVPLVGGITMGPRIPLQSPEPFSES